MLIAVNFYFILLVLKQTNVVAGRHIKWHETCKRKCALDASLCNNKQRWNDDKCRCECMELIDKGVCDKGYVWNPSNCECECNKSCDVSEYLGYKNCKCRKRLVDKMVEECGENIDEAKLTGIALLEHGNDCVCSYTVCIFLGVIALTIYIGIESMLILPINTSIKINKMFLSMIIPIMQKIINHIKWEK